MSPKPRTLMASMEIETNATVEELAVALRTAKTQEVLQLSARASFLRIRQVQVNAVDATKKKGGDS